MSPIARPSLAGLPSPSIAPKIPPLRFDAVASQWERRRAPSGWLRSVNKPLGRNQALTPNRRRWERSGIHGYRLATVRRRLGAVRLGRPYLLALRRPVPRKARAPAGSPGVAGPPRPLALYPQYRQFR